jgi:hypothetical protein
MHPCQDFDQCQSYTNAASRVFASLAQLPEQTILKQLPPSIIARMARTMDSTRDCV